MNTKGTGGKTDSTNNDINTPKNTEITSSQHPQENPRSEHPREREDKDMERPTHPNSETHDPTRKEPRREGQQEKETELPETPPCEWEVKGSENANQNKSGKNDGSGNDTKKPEQNRNL